jgi:hypothetical protein
MGAIYLAEKELSLFERLVVAMESIAKNAERLLVLSEEQAERNKEAQKAVLALQADTAARIKRMDEDPI